MAKHWFMIAVDSSDTREGARRRLGLEVARGLYLHLGQHDVWEVNDEVLKAIGTLPSLRPINYDPFLMVEQQHDG